MKKYFFLLTIVMLFSLSLLNPAFAADSQPGVSINPPAGFSARCVYKAVEMKWEPVANASYYLIFRNDREEFDKDTQKNNCILSVANTEKESIDSGVSEGQTYYYYILSVVKDKDNPRNKTYSAPSPAVKVVAEKVASPEPPANKPDGAVAQPNPPADPAKPPVAQNPPATTAPAQPEGNIAIDLQTTKGVDGSYAPGEELKIKFSVNEDAYVTVIDLGTSGKASVIFPNERATNNYIKKGDIYTFPENASSKITVQPPMGDEYILAIASRQKIAVSPQSLAALVLPGRYAVAGKAVAGKDLKMDTLPPNATPIEAPLTPESFQPFFDSVARESRAPFGSATSRIRIRAAEKMLRITSDPVGAKVLVDGAAVGQTPCDISGAAYPGDHEVTCILAGYETSAQKILFPTTHDKNLHVELKSLK